MAEPALRALPAGRIEAERDTWRHDHDAQVRAEQAAAQQAAHSRRKAARHHTPDHGPPKCLQGV